MRVGGARDFDQSIIQPIQNMMRPSALEEDSCCRVGVAVKQLEEHKLGRDAVCCSSLLFVVVKIFGERSTLPTIDL